MDKSSPLYWNNIKVRFWRKVNKQPGDGCWLWTASTDKDGYGQFRIGKRIRRAHRLSYEWEHGDCPEYLDHFKCYTRECVRPSHLKPTTNEENIKNRDPRKMISRPRMQVSHTRVLENREDGEYLVVTKVYKLLACTPSRML